LPTFRSDLFLEVAFRFSSAPADSASWFSAGTWQSTAVLTTLAPLLAAFFRATDLPTVTCWRIFSRRFGPMPLLARKSSTPVNWPYDLRIFTNLSAFNGPMPGTCCNSSAVAVFRFTGCSSRFLLACETGTPSKIIISAGNNVAAKGTTHPARR
jgi:hypothetical protein